jgi:uncharacterized repeat protein (TIGR03837 family)
MPRRARWDIFCTVVDNFGDIGVTWRLARQLAVEEGRNVVLWVDDLASFKRIEPAIDTSLNGQSHRGVEIRRWTTEFPDAEPADAVIEAFACHLPERYVARMAERDVVPAWINLEYLCAERWIEDTHALPSPHPRLPLTKYFFFPGFNKRTGGLLRESDLLIRRDALLADGATQAAFWHSLGIPPDRGDDVRVSLFCYPNPALLSLLDAWAAGPNRITCLLPEGAAADAVRAHFGLSKFDAVARGNLSLFLIPFVQQDDYDKLLWLSDVNFVRGEDSFLRAQWAGKPFIWHIYPQDDDVHWPKLEAFLDLYVDNLDPTTQARVKYAWHRWNRGQPMADAWRDFAAGRRILEPYALDWANRLAAWPGLARQLAEFVDKLL